MYIFIDDVIKMLNAEKNKHERPFQWFYIAAIKSLCNMKENGHDYIEIDAPVVPSMLKRNLWCDHKNKLCDRFDKEDFDCDNGLIVYSIQNFW